ncbi:phosphatase PAP2 family protein [Haloarchaeobius amylolyticus]|uniref:phosphatase PAP2 family protein n=1 Tax=Haloarchaeobius amylolyticus TaxID=1198296 RepID=UPI0022715D19|nr:phosphatase PAP2 family protein [Haloarchaeobius amylolyticus]
MAVVAGATLGRDATLVLTVFATLVSLLGDPSLLLALVTGLTVLDRERWVPVLAVTLGGYALTLGVETALAVPARTATAPPVAAESLPSLLRPLYEREAASDGYALPSGHVVAATVVWLQLAWPGAVGTRPGKDRLRAALAARRARIGLAATVVGLVAWSRVFLGAHVAVDVVAGVALGASYLLVVAAVWRRYRR